MSIYLSGIQPTGKIHAGNYFGCIKPFLKAKTSNLSEPRKNIFLIADMHCFTKPENVSSVRNQVFEVVRSLLAAGIDPRTTHFVQQSKVLEHANLAWYLSCLTKYSRAENMTQFKNNSDKHPNVGIFIYPILQAADILIYSPDYVLVGPDQKQHLEMTAELCAKANQISKAEIFKKPKLIASSIRIKNLKNGETKMSKSEPDGCLFLLDEPEIINKKIAKAKTDNILGISYDKSNRKPLANLIELLALMKNISIPEVIRHFGEFDHKKFKMALVEEFINAFSDFRTNYYKINDNDVHEILKAGTKAASEMASTKLQDFLTLFNK